MARWRVVKVTIIGCGGWGSRLAGKLHARGARLALVDEIPNLAHELASSLGENVQWSHDPQGYLAVTGTAESTTGGGAVVIATPPDTHLEIVRQVLNGYGRPPRLLRVEKPLAMSVADAAEIVRLCAAAGTKLTVGFTLLHDPLYEAAFDYLRAIGNPDVYAVQSVRIGSRPRHRCDVLLDQGIHGAAIGAYLQRGDGETRIDAAFSDTGRMRRTRILTRRAEIMVDEIASTVTTCDGQIIIDRRNGDALDRDLNAWLTGRHRGTPRVALEAQRIVNELIDRKAEAA